MNLKLDLNLKALLPQALKALPLVFGLALITIFGYTAYTINTALNLQPSATAVTPPAKITFDRKTLKYIEGLRSVSGQTGVTVVGKTNPFGN